MDLSEKELLKEFLVSLYGNQANNWNMSEEVFNITYKMIEGASSCSDAMDLVPRPHALGKAPIQYLKKEIRKNFIRELKDRKEYYKACLGLTALRYKSPIEIATLGY